MVPRRCDGYREERRKRFNTETTATTERVVPPTPAVPSWCPRDSAFGGLPRRLEIHRRAERRCRAIACASPPARVRTEKDDADDNGPARSLRRSGRRWNHRPRWHNDAPRGRGGSQISRVIHAERESGAARRGGKWET